MLLAIGLTVAVWLLSIFQKGHFDHLKDFKADKSNGKYVFNISGCANCHSSKHSNIELKQGGGKAFKSKFGVFYAPNISTSKHNGIGNWTINDFANAIKKGISPDNRHYFPAFPYTSYRLISDKDLADLWGFLQTLPAVDSVNREHELTFPVSFSPSIFLWKLFNFDKSWVKQNTSTRGRYLVEVLGHCGECHTPRSEFGGLNRSAWLQGAPHPSGEGKIPGITNLTLNWSKEEIVEYLSTGFTPDFDVAGGDMAQVIDNTSKLTNSDLEAIALYLIKTRPTLKKTNN